VSVTLNILVTLILIPWPAVLMMSPMMMAAPDMRNRKSSLWTVTVLLSYPVIVFAVLKLTGYPFWGMDAGQWLIGVSIVSGIVILLYGLPGMLINLNRGIQNDGYFKNTTSVFYDGKKIAEADPVSFTIIEEGQWYAKDNKHVFYMGTVVEDADPMTFIPVKTAEEDAWGKPSVVFWKDTTHVYFDTKKIEGCEAATFQYLKGIYGKDRHHVYYGNTILPNTNPDTFRFLEEGLATDGTSLFVFNKLVKTSVDLLSFEVVRKDDQIFCKDKHSIYLLLFGIPEPLVRLDGADVESFVLLDRYYAKDKHQVYFYGYSKLNTRALIHLTDANPATFRVEYDSLTVSEATDGEKYYMSGKLVK